MSMLQVPGGLSHTGHLVVVVVVVVVVTTGTCPGNVHFWQAGFVPPVANVSVSAQVPAVGSTLRAAPTSTASSLSAGGRSLVSMQSWWVTVTDSPGARVIGALIGP